MEHLNQSGDADHSVRIKNMGWRLFAGNVYRASSLIDFLDHKNEVKPTENLFPFETSLNCYATIQFPRFFYESLSEDHGLVSDFSLVSDFRERKPLEVRLDWQLKNGFRLLPQTKKKLRSEKILREPSILYSPKTGVSNLYTFKFQSSLGCGDADV